jgi:predicted metal-binding membrane protein
MPVAPHIPLGIALVLLLSGLFQLSKWKAGRLEKCRNIQACSSPGVAEPENALRQGLMWGVDCVLCCMGFMAVLMVTGVMNLSAMIAVALGITAERLLPRPDYASRASGIVMIAGAAFALVHALGN